eukprot:g2989.t1
MFDNVDELKRVLDKMKSQDGATKIAQFPSKKLYTPLHTAASRGCLASLKLLLSYGFDVNILDKSGNTALHEACRTENVDAANTLIQHPKLDVKIANQVGATALHYACMSKLKSVASSLIKRGADIYACTKLKTVAIDYVDQHLRTELIALYEEVHKERRKREREIKRANQKAAIAAMLAAESALKCADRADSCLFLRIAARMAGLAARTAASVVDSMEEQMRLAQEKYVANMQRAVRTADFIVMKASAAAASSASIAAVAVAEAIKNKNEREMKLAAAIAISKTNETNTNGGTATKTGASGHNSPPNGAINIHVGGNGGEGSSASPGPAGGNSSKNELRNWLATNKPPNERALKLMTVSDVVTFLKSMNLNVLAAACEKQDLDGEMLQVITRQQLDELELGTTIHRYKLMMLIDRYRSQSGDDVDMHNKTSLSAPNSPRDENGRQRKSFAPTVSAPTSPQRRMRTKSDTARFGTMDIPEDMPSNGSLDADTMRMRSISAVSTVSSGSFASVESLNVSSIDVGETVDDKPPSPSKPKADTSGRVVASSHPFDSGATMSSAAPIAQRHYRSVSAPPKPLRAPGKMGNELGEVTDIFDAPVSLVSETKTSDAVTPSQTKKRTKPPTIAIRTSTPSPTRAIPAPPSTPDISGDLAGVFESPTHANSREIESHPSGISDSSQGS